ncbi:hypothetical protein DFR70_108198 [Nocardia tenerifensis]|uniref:Peptidase inhibitor family I36 n=1 Tax=Nocardia tenerifensis TaxID=228006 RepID=A0A318JWI2_9NOCA|nr:hypothetical protein [Nocardia tenerifensis]PXX61640.1 hypothetical protein DFR70_108198 [Nocardia tenerifensis]
MRNALIYTRALTALVATTTAFAAGSGATTAPAYASPPAAFVAAKSCGFEFTYSRPSVYPPQIKGNGVAQCDAPPEEHFLTLSLEYKQGGQWVTAAYINDSGIPPGPPNSRSYEVSAACYAGTWRVSMSVTGRLQGIPFVFSDYSGTREISTSQCPSR